jgi:hypothetical protein
VQLAFAPPLSMLPSHTPAGWPCCFACLGACIVTVFIFESLRRTAAESTVPLKVSSV